MFENYIDKYKDDIVSKTIRLIQIPSIHEESKNPSKPFGEEADKALEYFLSLGAELGFRTKNIDGYCGYVEFGEGSELVGIIGHLDVVPVGDGWTYEPFEGTIHNGNLYGRGAIDDKGPVIASLYAMKVVMDNYKVNKRVRLIVGINEERDWKCIEYYKGHEEIPTIAFSPDADFPCIYAEKGVLTLFLQDDYSSYLNEPIIIEDVNCKNNAINVVPKECTTTIRINNDNISVDSLIDTVNLISEANSFKINIKKLDNKRISIISLGTASHAAHPEHGSNAISKLLVLLYEVFSKYNTNIGILHFFYNYLGLDYNGSKLGINIEDESGKLTINVGNISIEDNKLKLGLNIRVPVKTKLSIITDKFIEASNPYPKITVKVNDIKEPLYVPKNNYLINTLCDIYNKMTGQNAEPIAIGGATYARAFSNCVSFGANMPGNKDMCHQADEYININDLILASKIYAEAIYKLAN